MPDKNSKIKGGSSEELAGFKSFYEPASEGGSNAAEPEEVGSRIEDDIKEHAVVLDKILARQEFILELRGNGGPKTVPDPEVHYEQVRARERLQTKLVTAAVFVLAGTVAAIKAFPLEDTGHAKPTLSAFVCDQFPKGQQVNFQTLTAAGCSALANADLSTWVLSCPGVKLNVAAASEGPTLVNCTSKQ